MVLGFERHAGFIKVNADITDEVCDNFLSNLKQENPMPQLTSNKTKSKKIEPQESLFSLDNKENNYGITDTEDPNFEIAHKIGDNRSERSEQKQSIMTGSKRKQNLPFEINDNQKYAHHTIASEMDYKHLRGAPECSSVSF